MRIIRVRRSCFHLLTLALFLPLVVLIVPGSGASLASYRTTMGKTYYVALNGDDANPGSLSQPFRHIQKCADSAQSGDTCLIRAGSYHEAVTPPRSGTASAPITFAPYPGETVTLDGADEVSGWSPYQGHIYRTPITLPVDRSQMTGFFANQLFVDGVMMNEARWPNTGLDQLHPVLEKASGENSQKGLLEDPKLPDIDWNGATLHVWESNNPFTSQTLSFTRSGPHQLSFDDPCYPGCFEQNDVYYISGALAELDSGNEWYYDGKAHQLYLWTPNGDSPAGHHVEVKQRTLAFDLSGRSFIHLQGLHLFAATITTDDASADDVLDGLNVVYPSHYTLLDRGRDSTTSHLFDSGIVIRGTHNSVLNSVIAYSAGNGVSLWGKEHVVSNNLIHDVDWMGSYPAGVNMAQNGNTVIHNTIYNTGRSAINADWGGYENNRPFQNNRIAYNDMFSSDILSPDGAPIDTCCWLNGSGTSIDHNWVHDDGPDLVSTFQSAGIYLDNGSGNILVHHNVTWNIQGPGLVLNGSGNGHNWSRYNHVYNNTIGAGSPSAVNGVNVDDAQGTQLFNNIFSQLPGGGWSSLPTKPYGVEAANNLLGPFYDPQFVDPAHNNYHLQASSPAIHAGRAIAGIAPNVAGQRPDEGAYGYGDLDWYPGCSLPGCAFIGTLSAVQYASASNDVRNEITHVSNLNDGQYLGYVGINFGNGVTRFWANVGVDAQHAGGQLELHLDNIAGPLVGTLTIHNTGGYQKRQWQDTALSGVSGVHTLYLVARGNGVADLSAFRFSRSARMLVQAALQLDQTNSAHNYATYLSNIADGTWVEYQALDFGHDIRQWLASVAVDEAHTGGSLELHIDSPGGPLIGSLALESTGDRSTFMEQSTLVSAVQGNHDLYIVGHGDTTGVALAAFQFV